ncbi:tetratricopeptide repeat protein [Candidatus Daviesbacteria bacterium]|nr:tetratricopeptide repeat protein [Candidatus Daviesbacteria bacterium]
MKQYLNYLKDLKIQILIIIIATFLVYANTLANGFVIEDQTFISNWPLTQNLVNIPKMIAGDTIPTGNWGAYRPVRAIVYALSYSLFGGENAFLYHLQALVVHLSITLLIFFISRIIFRNGLLAMLAAILFGLHPVHTEAVDYLTANFDIIAYIFFFGSFLLYLYACHSEAKTKNLDPSLALRMTKKTIKMTRNTLRMTPFIFSIIFANLAFYHSEMTLTLPLLIILYDFCFNKLKIKNWKLKIPQYAPYFISAFFFLFIRFAVMQINVRGEYLGGSIYFTFLTMLKVILRYFEWLIFPLNLSINPTLPGGISAWNHPLSHPERIIQQSIFEPAILFSIALISVSLVLAVYCFKKYPIVTFSIGWFFISILPVLHIIPQGTIFQERYIYIASFGYVILLAWLVGYLYSYKWNKDVKQIVHFSIIIFLVVVLIFYSAKTFLRNRDWKDSLALWAKLAQQSPSDVIANFHSARLYKEINQDELAIAHFNQALAAEPNLFEVHYGLGEIYLENAEIEKSMNYFSNALKINPTLKSAENAIKNKDLIIESTNSAFFKSGISFIDYNLPSGFIFSFPFNWEIVKKDDSVTLNDPNQGLEIEISEDIKPSFQKPEDFIKAEKSDYGKLINEGLVQTSNFDYAYVKVWEKSDRALGTREQLQFFLFKDEKVIIINVSPADSLAIATFNQIISSLRLNQNLSE